MTDRLGAPIVLSKHVTQELRQAGLTRRTAIVAFVVLVPLMWLLAVIAHAPSVVLAVIFAVSLLVFVPGVTVASIVAAVKERRAAVEATTEINATHGTEIFRVPLYLVQSNGQALASYVERHRTPVEDPREPK